MSHTPHELVAELPEYAERIHSLKSTNQHFARLAESYHEVNREIHRIASEIEHASDEHVEALKKQRLLLLDQCRAVLAETENTGA
ncbi:YdcH family protein [Methyloraptor flagellatus]|jgi:uncharacterized protein YdcH (DUF465 family)|uniref:DUF465 domain-containing protein n=1 Tax=Methyloraptor flagellatus TaxID=3162530 RepID=A0AAU7X5L2_9HYPH